MTISAASPLVAPPAVATPTVETPVALSDLATRHGQALAALAALSLDGLFVPHEDAYFNEELPPDAELLAWLTGFTGSAGLALLHREGSTLWVDGRYPLQAQAQVDPCCFAVASPTQPPADAPPVNVPSGVHRGPVAALNALARVGRIGVDPWCHPQRTLEAWQRVIAARGGELVFLDANPLLPLWAERPARSAAAAYIQGLEYAGESAAAKCQRLGEQLHGAQLDAQVLTDPTTVNWLLNLRGSDVAHTPLVLARAILHRPTERGPTVELFVDPRQVDGVLAKALGDFVRVAPPDAWHGALARLRGKRVRVHQPSGGLRDHLQGHDVVIDEGDDLVALARAIKHPVEQDGMRTAHVRDGVALVEWLNWLDREDPSQLDELAVADQLLQYRQQQPDFIGPSFPTIAGFGPNGAVVHYRATAATNRRLDEASLLLLDSGGQYRLGTTDVTRTLAIGAPTPEQRRHFTHVLMAHISLALARFPEGTPGAQLDGLARIHLWQHGLDYDHGTGHGVGCFLSVHEGPIGLSARAMTPLRAGMVLSNEPGYYAENAYGIRLENLVLTVGPQPIEGGNRPMLAFETLTLCPFDRRLVDLSVLSDPARDWLNQYHRQVYDRLAPHLSDGARHWLDWATRRL